jgi:hypothetical protein
MIESSMYLGIGLLFGALMGLALIPLVHGRAVRLTTRRLHAVLPESMAEVKAEKDLLRAEFAMSTRRLEITVEELMNKTTRQVVELSKKNDVINQLKFERDSQEIEIIALKTHLEALKERPAVIHNQVELKGDGDPGGLGQQPTGTAVFDISREPQLNHSAPFAAEVAPNGDAKQKLVSEESP